MEKRIERVRTAIGTVKNVVLADEQEGIFISVNPLTKAWMQRICEANEEEMPEIVNGYYHFAYPEYLSSNIYPYSAKKYRKQLGSVSEKYNKEELQEDYWCAMLDYMDDVQAPPIGSKGTVRGVDAIGSIMVDWDEGGSLSVVYGEDRCHVVKEG